MEHHRSSAFLYSDGESFITDYKIAANQVSRAAALGAEESVAFINKVLEGNT